MMRLLLSALCLTVASLSPAGDLKADHAHHHSHGEHTHKHSAATDTPLTRARKLQSHHKFGEAADVLGELLEQDPLNREAQLLLADVLLHDDQIEDARSACVRVAVSGAHTLANYCAVQVLTASGEPERAFRTAQDLSYDELPNDAKLWALEIAAVAAWKAGKTDTAEKWFQTALSFDNVPHSITHEYAEFIRSRQAP